MKNKTTLIIGAGPAGLTAAYELLKETDYIPIVIEADSQVGGLSKTVDYKGNKIDIGGHRFFSKSQKVIDWWLQFLPLQSQDGSTTKIHYHNKEAQITSKKPVIDNESVMLVRPRKSRILFNKVFFDYPLRLNTATIKKLGFIKLCRAGVSYIKAKIFPEKEEKNLAQFFRNRFGKNLYETFFKDYTEKVWGVTCEEIPADWGRQRVKDLNVGKVLKNAVGSFFSKDKSLTQQNTSTSLIEQFLYPKYGPGQMWEAVAEAIVNKGGQLILNTEVKYVNFNSESRVCSVTTQNKQTGVVTEIEAAVFFSTMPVKDLINCATGIGFTKDVKLTADSLQYRDFLIVGLLIDKLLLTDENKKTITDNWIYLQDKGIKAGRLQIFNNWSPEMVRNVDKIWMGLEFFCNESELFWQKTDKEIIAQAIYEMQHIGLVDSDNVEDAVVLRVKKAYPSYHGSYTNFDIIKKQLLAIPNLYCIGRNGMHKYNNSDHSMLTAMASVNHLVNGGDRNLIWDINTEEDYHEVK